MIILDLKGNIIPEATYPYISTVWHKSFGKNVSEMETYCHSAHLYFESSEINQLAKVSIHYHSINRPDKKEQSILKLVRTQYLPVSCGDGVVDIPLISRDIINTLVLNTWTKGKEGNLKNHTEFPVRLEVEYGGRLLSYDFDSYNGHTPHLMAKPHIADLADNQKQTVLISLSPVTYPENLFDLNND
ncbi:MAG: hypothetical protein HDR80_00475 [Bacteroides sp.]|nr:hypothetical protein [Bacteroides sp.]